MPDNETAEENTAVGETAEENTAGGENIEVETASDETAEQTPAARPRRQRTTARSRQSASVDTDLGTEEATQPPHPRLLETYRSEIVSTMMSEFGYTNTMRVPRIRKVTLNIGLGEALTNGRAMEAAVQDLTTISGQKPVITRAKKSIANFKLREGNPIGTSVTLRGARMYHFIDRLVNTALPRIRDFRGISRRGFDGRGNFSIGIREQIIFPEIDYNQIDRIRGLLVTIGTSASNDAEAMRLLELFGMPFVSQD